MKKRLVAGAPSWTFQTDAVHAAITCKCGHLGPVKFRLGKHWIQPFDVAPWSQEKLPKHTPPLLRRLRGDFFCLPFGESQSLYNHEQHPLHGETANATWHFESYQDHQLHLSLQLKIRRGRVDKFLRLVPGHTAIYSQHLISGMSGPMSLGHHPILKIPDAATAHISVSPFRFGRVHPGSFETPAQSGYSRLKPGALFSSLKRVPQIDGRMTDLSLYPSREGFDDLVQLITEDIPPFAWTAAAIPEAGYVFFSLKVPRILRSTILWMSNGGRHYPPWNGRHRRVIGLEEVTSYFANGLAESAGKNPLNKLAIPTVHHFSPKEKLAVNFIMAVTAIPHDFRAVKKITPAKDQQSVTLHSTTGKKVSTPIDLAFLNAHHTFSA